MKKYFLFILIVILTEITFSQSRVLTLTKSVKNSFVVNQSSKSNDVLQISTSLSYISFNLNSTKGGDFATLESDGLIRTYNIGKPNIPVFSKLIELPLEASVKFSILSYDEEIIDLGVNGINQKIIPAQPSILKTNPPDNFYYDQSIYNENQYFNTEITSFENVGIMRSVRLGRIEIRPIQYNPVQNKLRILNNLKIEIEFIGSNHIKTQEMKAKYSNYLFNDILRNFIPNLIEDNTKGLINPPVTYVIISGRMFESTLAPFISEKQNLGYKLIIGYTDDANVGNTTTSIKKYLQGLYNNPPTGYDSPVFVLLVGDIQQIPTYYNNGPCRPSGKHATDLYYFDYTGDNIPDVFYGRFSAQNTSQLIPQIDKTLEYELYTMPDPTYVYKSVLIAGYDGGGNDLTYGNEQIEYGTNEYFNSTNGITTNEYLQPEPSGGNYASNIISNINSGVGFANYTAHGDWDRWYDPSFTVDDIHKLTNSHKYGLWIGNCCLANSFDEDECFGEAALRQSNGGAIGYIGATDCSYWPEDFMWADGAKNINTTLNPTPPPAYTPPAYDANYLGAYDRLFHTHNESTNDWYSMQGQILCAGKLAVEESTSSRKLYYWEIYNLMGDPSLNMRFVPTNCVDNLTITDNISGGIHEYLAHNSMTATNKILNNANIHYGANNSIYLLPGFNVELGSNFIADLHGCGKKKSISHESENKINLNGNKIIDKTSTDFSEDPVINVYPNPSANGQFSIEIICHNSIPQCVNIFNSFGSMIYKNCNLDASPLIVNINAKGLTFVNVNFNNKFITKKLILE